MDGQAGKFKILYIFYFLSSLILILAGWGTLYNILGPPYAFGGLPVTSDDYLILFVTFSLGFFLLFLLARANNKVARVLALIAFIISLVYPPVNMLVKSTWEAELPPKALVVLEKNYGDRGADFHIVDVDWCRLFDYPNRVAIGDAFNPDRGGYWAGYRDVYCVTIETSEVATKLILGEVVWENGFGSGITWNVWAIEN